MEKIPLLVVCGPTASGKTGLSISLANSLNGEIVCADSMQIYKHMNIGTAKPTMQEMAGIPHHLFDFVNPKDTYSVADYARDARRAISDIASRGKLAILTGGTGLYISAVCDNVQFAQMETDGDLRIQLEDLAKTKGNGHLWQMLSEVDPALANTLHQNNLTRVIRGIEVHRLTGVPLSQHHIDSKKQPSPYKVCRIALEYSDREKLYQRINQRVDIMLEQGLAQETQSLLKMGYSKTSVQAIGYKELFDYLYGRQTLEDAADNIKQKTRNYAKRQMTWLRREENVNWIQADKSFNILQESLDIVGANLLFGGEQ